MTAEEFEQRYAHGSGLTVKRLRELGRVVATCDCGEPECEGFQSINKELLNDLNTIYGAARYKQLAPNPRAEK